MHSDEIARGMAARALKEIQTLSEGDPLITSVNGQTGAVNLTAHDLSAEKEGTVVNWKMGRVYATMSVGATANVTNLVGGVSAFNTICDEINRGEKKVVLIDGMNAIILNSTSTSLDIDISEMYALEGEGSAIMYSFTLSTVGDSVELDLLDKANIDLSLQADYNQDNPNYNDYIKNKPTLRIQILNVSQDSQGHTVVEIDKTRQQIVNAVTLGKLAYMTYDAKTMFYGELGGIGFHSLSLIPQGNTIVAGEDNIAVGFRDISLLFANSSPSATTLLLTTLIYEP